MKHLLTVILGLAVLVATVAGCGGAHRYDGRLAAADSLMRPDPDSALAIVKAVNRDSLSTEGARAYRDLLLTQARYRCYEAATSDSDINRALAWYRAHSGEREKLTRALIYKGAVMEELGHPDSAMLYYKQAEATADEKDYFNLGQINTRIASLYRIHYANSVTGFEKYQLALRYYTFCGDSSLIVNCLYNMAIFHGIVSYGGKNDYLEQAIEMATKLKDSFQLYDCYELKCRQLIIKDSAMSEAIELARRCLSEFKGYINNDLLLDLAEAYAKLGINDSAKFFVGYVDEKLAHGEQMRIRIRKNDVLSLIATNAGNRVASDSFLAISHSSSDSLMNNKLKNQIESIENSFNVKKNGQSSSRVKELKLISGIISGLLLFILVLWIVTNLKKRKRFNTILKNIESASLDRNDGLLKSIGEKDSVIGHFVKNVINMTQQLFESKASGTAPNIEVMIQNIVEETKDDDFWNGLQCFLDRNHSNIITNISRTPKITQKDLRFIELCCCGFSYIEMAIILGYSPQYISNKRKIVAKKLGIDSPLQEYLEGLLLTHDNE